MTYGSRCRFATSDVTDGLVEEYRGAPRPVWVQREIRYFANARPAERDIQPLGGGAFARVEQEKREALLGGVALELFHECAGDAASTRAPMDHELGDVGAVWLVRCPRRLQLDSADNPVAVSLANVCRHHPAASWPLRSDMKLTPAPLSTASMSTAVSPSTMASVARATRSMLIGRLVFSSGAAVFRSAVISCRFSKASFDVDVETLGSKVHHPLETSPCKQRLSSIGRHEPSRGQAVF